MNSLWDILSVAIGISFIFMILSILNSWIQDYISSLFDLRANNLADIMQNLLEPGVLKLNGKDRARATPADNRDANERSSYKVKPNETLSSIAKAHDVAVADLRNANLNVLDELSLQPGITIGIPEYSYVVEANDILSNIVESVKESIEGLQRAHPDGSPGEQMPTLKSVGEELDVPISSLRNANREVLDELPLQEETTLQIPGQGADAYKARENDTLHNVAEKFKVTIDNLRNANLTVLDELSLREGTTLKIPEIRHDVEGEDTLKKLSEAYKRSSTDLINANPDVFNELTLPPGVRLKFPEPKADRYTVLPGDTLERIALGFGISLEELQKANPRLKALQEGITLEIPKPDIGQLMSRRDTFRNFALNPVATLYKHPAIHSLSKPFKLPERIPTKDFTVALLDLLDDLGRPGGKEPTDTISIDFIIKGIKKLERMGWNADTGRKVSPPLAFRLRTLLYAAQINTQISSQAKAVEATLQEFHTVVSEWFDNTVARGSGWYKRRMQQFGIISGFILAIVLNADTLGLSNALWHNAILRESITQAAQAAADTGKTPDPDQAKEDLNNLLNLGLPLGWTFKWADTDPDTPDNPRDFPSSIGGWFTKVVGLFLTGLAISQGSQLWFDLMNRLLNLRSPGSQSNAEEPREKERSKQG